jgi:dihydrofolate reductase
MTVRFEISMSLDGYVTAANPTLEEPMGPGGQILMEHWSADEAGRRALDESQASVGASIAGRRTYDTSIAWWQAGGPGGELRTPTFIVSHTTPDDVPADGVYTFMRSPEQALDAARAVAGEKDVDIFSANIGQQLLAAGHVDEVRIHLVPVLLGTGTRLTDNLNGRHIRLRRLVTAESQMATHLHYAVVKADLPPDGSSAQ